MITLLLVNNFFECIIQLLEKMSILFVDLDKLIKFNKGSFSDAMNNDEIVAKAKEYGIYEDRYYAPWNYPEDSIKRIVKKISSLSHSELVDFVKHLQDNFYDPHPACGYNNITFWEMQINNYFSR